MKRKCMAVQSGFSIWIQELFVYLDAGASRRSSLHFGFVEPHVLQDREGSKLKDDKYVIAGDCDLSAIFSDGHSSWHDVHSKKRVFNASQISISPNCCQEKHTPYRCWAEHINGGPHSRPIQSLLFANKNIKISGHYTWMIVISQRVFVFLPQYGKSEI